MNRDSTGNLAGSASLNSKDMLFLANVKSSAADADSNDLNIKKHQSNPDQEELNDKVLLEMEEELMRQDKGMGINPNIHKEVVDELEETRNVESV